MVSLAYSLIFEETLCGISFTKIKNNKGASTVPWGTPDVTIDVLLLMPSIITL